MSLTNDITEENPWAESQGPSSALGTSDNEDYIKPIRLAKRSEAARLSYSNSNASSSRKSSLTSIEVVKSDSSRRLSQSSADSPSKPRTLSTSSNLKSPTEEFQCRPMRLKSGLKPRELAPPVTSPTESPVRRKSIRIKSLPINKIVKEEDIVESSCSDSMFAVCVVDFHHQRGPEIQWWKSNYHPNYTTDLFKNLPFQALPDGSHLFEETFSNFNLAYDFKSCKSIDDLAGLNDFKGDPRNLKTLFGCSCVRQLKTRELAPEELERNKDITRSMVQKAVVVISRKQPIFTKIKEKLSIVTHSYFQQNELQNFEILESLFDNLNKSYKLGDNEIEVLDFSILEDPKTRVEEEFFVNLDLKQSILRFKNDFMVIFKSLLLDKKILIYSNNNLEMLTLFQNNLISLIPNLINNLDNCGCPLIDYIETNGPLTKPTALNTSNRKSLLRFFGLPLQIFNTKNAFWNPYLPLQQLDELSVESFMVGCSNLLFLNQAENYKIDIIVNLDNNELTFPKGKSEEYILSSNDKNFIFELINKIGVDDGKFEGNDDYIRYQFEDYITSLISTMRYHQYVDRFKLPPPGFENSQDMGDINLFNKKFIECWKLSNNYKIWNIMADEFIFNFANPQHIGLSMTQTSQAYKNITNFINSFKMKPEQKFSEPIHSSKPQKFLDSPTEDIDEPVMVEDNDPPSEPSGKNERSTASGGIFASWPNLRKKK